MEENDNCKLKRNNIMKQAGFLQITTDYQNRTLYQVKTRNDSSCHTLTVSVTAGKNTNSTL